MQHEVDGQDISKITLITTVKLFCKGFVQFNILLNVFEKLQCLQFEKTFDHEHAVFIGKIPINILNNMHAGGACRT